MTHQAITFNDVLLIPGVVEKIDYCRPFAQNMHFLYDHS